MWYNWLFLLPDGCMNQAKLDKYNNSLEFQKWFTRLYCMVLRSIKFEGLPETANERYLKMCILNNGTAGMFNINGSLLTLGAAPCGEYNIYGDWTKALAWGFNKPMGEHKLYMPGAQNQDTAEAVLCRANDIQYAPIMWIYRMAERISRAARTIDVLSEQLKATRIVLCDETQVSSYKNILNKVYENQTVMFASKNINPEAIKSIPTAIDPGTLNTAWDNFRNLVDEFCIDWGVENGNHTDKKERLLEAEINSNNAFTARNRDIILGCMEDFCENCNLVFGLNMSVTMEGGEWDEAGQDGEDHIFGQPESGSGSYQEA